METCQEALDALWGLCPIGTGRKDDCVIFGIDADFCSDRIRINDTFLHRRMLRTTTGINHWKPCDCPCHCGRRVRMHRSHYLSDEKTIDSGSID